MWRTGFTGYGILGTHGLPGTDFRGEKPIMPARLHAPPKRRTGKKIDSGGIRCRRPPYRPKQKVATRSWGTKGKLESLFSAASAHWTICLMPSQCIPGQEAVFEARECFCARSQGMVQGARAADEWSLSHVRADYESRG